MPERGELNERSAPMGTGLAGGWLPVISSTLAQRAVGMDIFE